MKMSGRRILKTTAAVVGISALGAMGTGTAFAAAPTGLGDAPTGHGTSTIDNVGLTSPASSKGSELHTFAMPKMATHIAEPTTRYNDNNDNNSDYGSSRYDDNNYDSSRYDNNSNYDGYDNNNSDYNGYDNNYDNGYYDNGYRHNGNGLLGGGLLGGNN